MLTRDEMQMMERCAQEMEMLREQNKIMGAQLAVVDVFARVVGLAPKSGGFSEDIVHKLKQTLKKYRQEEENLAVLEKELSPELREGVLKYMNDKTGTIPNPLADKN